MHQNGYTVIPFPKIRQPVVDSLNAARRMNAAHSLLEVDVTEARKKVKEFRKKTGEQLSFTAFLTHCLGRAVDENRVMHAYRKGSRLIIYDDVDISVLIEREIGGEKAPLFPHVIKAANRKTLTEIHNEIRSAQGEDKAQSARRMNAYYCLPGFIRGLLWKRWLGSPAWRKKLTGTVGMSAVGMFGRGTGWGIPVPTYNLNVTVGGIAEKPGIIQGQVTPREYLCLTVSFNHDVIDGAPAARFMQRFRELIESGSGLDD
jgi:pyruvate/2-oxoglutarate dehydrogenase complex dihydrolipoamide acyltransferase (E2) component